MAAGRRRNTTPPWRRVEIRPVDLKAGRVLQVVAYDERQAHTSNHAYGPEAQAALADLLATPFGNWHVDTTEGTVELRVTDSCPDVDTVVLIAGLFRGLVLRARQDYRAGLPFRPTKPPLHRAAMWRAARWLPSMTPSRFTAITRSKSRKSYSSTLLLTRTEPNRTAAPAV